jgi:inorganic pyrophosphatase
LPTRDLSKLRAFGPRSAYVNVVIETPKGSRYKYKLDEDEGLFVLDKAMPVGQHFAFDFGFVPSTQGEDGDPLDVLVLTEEPTFPGCLIHAKLLGVIEAEQTNRKKAERNDRIIAVPIEVSSGKPPAGAPEKLTSELVRNIEKFFVSYNEAQGRKFKVLRHAGPKRAAALIRYGQEPDRS